jgi:hypothetical protein
MLMSGHSVTVFGIEVPDTEWLNCNNAQSDETVRLIRSLRNGVDAPSSLERVLMAMRYHIRHNIVDNDIPF